MKKKRFASLLLLAPLALLAACNSTPKLALEANWFSNTSTKIIPDDFEETLEYAVSFEKSAAALNGRFSVDYPNGGTYTVKFTSGSTADGKKTYIYTTEEKMDVRYTLDGKSTELMTDVVTTRVEFLDVSNDLKPLTSWREVHATVPLRNPTAPAATLDACYAKVDYKNVFTYDHEKSKATFVQTNLALEDKENNQTTTVIGIGGKGIFFDNEQLIPLLRAADLSSSMTIRTIDTQTSSKCAMTIKSGPSSVTVTQKVKLKSDEEAVERNFNANEISLAYKKQNSGPSQKFTIAQRGSRDSNTFRNVCLKFEQPIIYSQGTLIYRLVSANFYN